MLGPDKLLQLKQNPAYELPIQSPPSGGFLFFLFNIWDNKIMENGVRSRNLFNPTSKEPFRLSRSKIELFTECALCFYLDRRLGIGRPPGFPFTLNNAVDTLFKKEFDIHRAGQTTHPLMKAYGIDAVPYDHEKIEEWRDALRRGIRYLHPETNFMITGGIDDVWVDRNGQLIIVDYKATATESEITLDTAYRAGYKRQMEVYQWLFRQNGFKVSDAGYFVYANGKTDRKAFDGKLEFDVILLKHVGNDRWVEEKLIQAKECLMGALPKQAPNCEYCNYRSAAVKLEK